MSGEKMKKIGEKIVNFLELPQDVIFVMPNLHLIGNQVVKLENHRGIIEYGENQVRLGTGFGEIKITGANFILQKMDKDEIVFKGRIRQIELLDWRES